MTIPFEWKVLFHTIEAQLVHHLQALRSAEVLQERTLKRGHPLFVTHCLASEPVQLPVCGAALTHKSG